MNSFANSLFSLLFGWARTLIQQVWTSAAYGQYNGFFVWLGDHWMWLALVLCIGCTVMDFLIWLVRWRPYLAWRSALRRLARRLRGETAESSRRFEQGYQGGVALDIPPEPASVQDSAWEAEAEAESAAWQQIEPAQPFARFAQQANSADDWQQPEPAEDTAGTAAEIRQRQFAVPGYELPPVYGSSRPMASFSSDMPTARRKRRSEKYERRRPEWREKLIKGDAEEDTLLDGLPPAVDRQQAFHEPVYPRQSGGENPYSAWQRPQDDAK